MGPSGLFTARARLRTPFAKRTIRPGGPGLHGPRAANLKVQGIACIFTPQSANMARLMKKNSLLSMVNGMVIDLPTPANISYL
jgi:hypothetical protein